MWFGAVRSSVFVIVFFFQAEDGIRDLVRSRGLGDVYKRQAEVASPVDERLAVTLQIDDPNLRTYLVWFARYGLSLIHI